jgi:histidyl-tRNA synthetase
MANKASVPKGTRDFKPDELVKRRFIFSNIESVYRKFGFVEIETPSMENIETLTGKYGDEGDKLLFRILNSGDYLAKADKDALQANDSQKLSASIAEKGLRYDLTVPFARFVVQHRNEIQFPFKRYQLQAVWRADRPQKGRYREFYQCDADIIGSKSLLNEAELVQIIDEVFKRLNIRVEIRLNNRKILQGLAEIIKEEDKFMAITIAIDKLDKIGIEKVREELSSSGLKTEAIDKIHEVLSFEGSLIEKISFMKNLFNESEIGMEGLAEMQKLYEYLSEFKLLNEIHFDLTLARGLNYYTGTIIEVVAKDVSMGSICGGGRYDDLTSIFGLNDVSGVGISFGADRIYDVMQELDVFGEIPQQDTKLLIINFGEEDEKYALKALSKLRANNIASEIYPDTAKIKKQMNYTNARGIPFVIMAGESERIDQKYTLKNMESGEQQLLSLEEIINLFK